MTLRDTLTKMGFGKAKLEDNGFEASTAPPGESGPRKFGTFLGVYLPSLLTILGLIMYLRFGWVVGNLGLGLTLLVVLLASSITFITGLSASAIATNMRVGAGGEYYMISRSLGLELGGAIGIPLYLCRTLSITFYCFGLAEAVALFIPELVISEKILIQLLAAGIVILTTLLSSKSASLVLKLQIPILIFVGLSVVALIVGISMEGFRQPDFRASYITAPQGFWYVFAVFFPAVTGFTAGIGLSGDLRNPQSSIPRGTMGAIITGLLIYIAIPILLSISAGMTQDELAQSGVETWTKVAIFGGILVFPAIWGAILSSAFGSVLSGPRVLQALSKDKLAPKVFSQTSATGEPVKATLISGAIALLAVALGGLNTVAQFVSILFLTLYVMINLSAVVEYLVGDPSYRPTIKVHWIISLAGAIGAILVMFLISPLACLVALILEFLLYMYLRGRTLQKEWGDARAGLWFNVARYALVHHRPARSRTRNWRPTILTFVSDIKKDMGLLRLSCWFSHNTGIVTASHLVEGTLEEKGRELPAMRNAMNRAVINQKITAFSEVNVVTDFVQGAIHVAQANGIAGIKSNTVVFGWAEHEDRLIKILKISKTLSKAGISTVLPQLEWSLEPGQAKDIHLWWSGRNRNGDLMLLFAHLLSLNEAWAGATITIHSIVSSEQSRDRLQNQLRERLPRIRIRARISVHIKTPHESESDMIQRYSEHATVTFLGMTIPENDEYNYLRKMQEMSARLNTTIFVHNAEATIPVLLALESPPLT